MTSLNGQKIGDGKVGKIYSQILAKWCSESKVKIDQQIKNWNKIDHNIKTNNSPTPYKFK